VNPGYETVFTIQLASFLQSSYNHVIMPYRKSGHDITVDPFSIKAHLT